MTMEENRMGSLKMEIVDHIAILTFCRPPINAVDMAGNLEITHAFEEINRNDDVWCVIFRGEGKGFISGSDTGDFDAFDDKALEVYEDADIDAVCAIENCRVPVIGQLQGYVMGLGTCFAAACDMLVAADDTYFGQPEVTICVCGGTGALRQLMPEKMMRYMALTGKRVGVEKIAQYGQIHAVVPRAQAMERAMELAHEVTANYTKSVQCVKAAIRELVNRDTAKEYRIDCKQTHIMLKDPKRDEVLAAHNEMLRKKRGEKAARTAQLEKRK